MERVEYRSMNKVLSVAAVVALSGMVFVGCEKTDSGAAPAKTGGTSLADKAKDATKGAADATKDAVKSGVDATKDAAKTATDAAKAGWESLRTKAADEGGKALAGLKTQIEELKASKPQLHTSLSELMKNAEAKLTELKGAGADKWQSLSTELTGMIDKIKTQLKG